MNSGLSLGQLNAKLASYKRFSLVHDDPLTPIGFAVSVSNVTVCLSAYPYISLRVDREAEEYDWICLSHIGSVKLIDSHDSVDNFELTCLDFLANGAGEATTFSLICYKT